ncbi:prolyl oligopeptidase family serine peptidase [Gloeobacter kilaueensis]|uniref:prolyl oligopeptidase n=1 Tax=Gloeobacter kilaueensis (strain ATCC BAA-2537 / CCAP 1431/1 / ULC 316 / JS1) TaxID=1183438 RepID=U5QPT0_GLOK1|nr:prolyl oligopeptidase family serine peptidase [Gloeobacter kilaueensis]AGY59634.1 prolyl endopeptidase [Gloeobacter kilaueensis JS1]
MKRFTLSYPKTRRVEQVDDYHGTLVADPYRWLEDPDSPETREWVAAQNAVTFDFLEAIAGREAIKKRLEQLWDYERYGIPFKEGNRYFLFKNSGLQNQSVLYTATDLESEPAVLLDPNTLSEDGTIALSGLALSDDGLKLAYGTSASGSDWQQWQVRDVETGADLPDVVRWVKFSSAAWSKDGSGFFYSRYDEPDPSALFQEVNYFQKLYFHRLGTDQEQDLLVYERTDQKEWGFQGEVSEDGRYLIITVSQGTDTKNRLFYKDLSDPDAPIVELLPEADAAYAFIANEGPLFWLMSDRDAPRGRVVAIDTTKPLALQPVIPESTDTLQGVSLLGERFFAAYLKDARTEIRIFDLSGQFLEAVNLPGIGSASGFGGRRSTGETFFAFTSFTTPTTIYRYDLASDTSTVLFQPTVDFKPEDFFTEQVFYTSKDGTRVPMFITGKKNAPRDGNNPTYLYGYGGFNVSLTPEFSPSILTWLELGGLYAVPNLRGGGEYGEEWHQAGTVLDKQNVFDDFIAAAEYLISQGYTRSEQLAIGGGSNGGLLVGAVLTQRPELFAAALPAVGVLDMLRFQKFTIGWAWVSDYGSSDDPEQFRALYAYSPLHNLKPGTPYPATLITTADHDDRVVPAHSFKFAAALQAAQSGDAPVLIRIETRAGHGAGKPTSKRIEEAADRWAFLAAIFTNGPLTPGPSPTRGEGRMTSLPLSPPVPFAAAPARLPDCPRLSPPQPSYSEPPLVYCYWFQGSGEDCAPPCGFDRVEEIVPRYQGPAKLNRIEWH